MEPKCAITVEDELGEWVEVKREFRQKLVLSSDLISLYKEFNIRRIEGQPGVIVGCIHNNLRYADDIVLIAAAERSLTYFGYHQQNRESSRG